MTTVCVSIISSEIEAVNLLVKKSCNINSGYCNKMKLSIGMRETLHFMLSERIRSIKN